jgi:hypothetical protein
MSVQSYRELRDVSIIGSRGKELASYLSGVEAPHAGLELVRLINNVPVPDHISRGVYRSHKGRR